MVDDSRSFITVRVNDERREVPVADNATLLELLREDLRLTGTNHGCDLGECGACTVLLDGTPTLSCLTLAREADGRDVTTVEGLGDADTHPLQESFVENGAAQCGYCTPGMLMTAADLLERNEDPTRAEIENTISGNYCRCTGYAKIVDAIAATSKEVS